MDNFIKDLLKKEENAITEVIAFMSYNPSIGRVLQAGGVKKFRRLATKLVDELPSVKDRDSFDKLHHKFIKKMVANFETAKGETLSYGQAQKPINVFLKVYVDWAHRPSPSIRKRLLRHLHVPLDSILIWDMRHRYKKWHSENIRPYLENTTQIYALSSIDKWQYDKWQELFRKEYPPKPLIFDVIWAINRNY